MTSELEHPADRVSNDRAAQVSHVHLLGDVGTGEVHHYALGLGYPVLIQRCRWSVFSLVLLLMLSLLPVIFATFFSLFHYFIFSARQHDISHPWSQPYAYLSPLIPSNYYYYLHGKKALIERRSLGFPQRVNFSPPCTKWVFKYPPSPPLSSRDTEPSSFFLGLYTNKNRNNQLKYYRDQSEKMGAEKTGEKWLLRFCRDVAPGGSN